MSKHKAIPRKRMLLNLAHRVHDCMNCGRWSEHGCEPAHENGPASGKGVGLKAPDHRHAALCNACHGWFDGGAGMDPSGLYHGSRAYKKEMWTRAHFRTMDFYWGEGWIRVAD